MNDKSYFLKIEIKVNENNLENKIYKLKKLFFKICRKK